MAKTFITAHIKLEDEEWQSLGRQAENHDFTTAQLVRKILRGWLDQQVFVQADENGPLTAQNAGHVGFNPKPIAITGSVMIPDSCAACDGKPWFLLSLCCQYQNSVTQRATWQEVHDIRESWVDMSEEHGGHSRRGIITRCPQCVDRVYGDDPSYFGPYD